MKTDKIIEPPASRILKSSKVILLPNEEVGEHVTDKKEEIIIVLKGNATLIEEGKAIILKKGDAHYIKEGVRHNIRNDSDEVLEYIYVVGLHGQ